MRGKFLIFSIFSFAFCYNVSAQKVATPSVNNIYQKPKLVVGLVLDQMRWDYLYRFYNKYTEGGFKRLLKKGYSYENTIIPYTPTVTAAGHTCIYTGSVPAIHGIVGNDWTERLTGEFMYCSQDKSVQTVGSYSNQGQMSPRNMFTTTVGDELRIASNFKSKVFGVALKDRGAILPAGHSANGAYWFDDSTGNWITSTYYTTALPGWVNNFNAEKRADAYIKTGWNAMNDIDGYDESTADDKPYERLGQGETKHTFPHAYTSNGGKNYVGVRTSPFGNTVTLDFAQSLLKNEKLGTGNFTDMLCVSLSSTDYIGHRFGPQSVEVEDMYLRLDKELAAFFTMLDNTIGVNKYVLFLTADHGAPNTPDFMKENKLPGGTLSGFRLATELNNNLFQKFKVGNLIKNYSEYQIYFDNSKLDSSGINKTELENYVIELLIKKPEVLNAFSYKNFANTILAASTKEKIANGYYYKRSGDIQIIYKANYTDYLSTGTDHGSSYNYDTHIPLIWFGNGIKSGKSNREVYMTDIASTVAAMLQIQSPSGNVGKVLQEVVQ